jgi:hypothetical protein
VIALAGLHPLQYDYAALESDRERSQFKVGPKLAAVFRDTWECSFQFGNIDTVVDDAVERGLLLLHSAFCVLRSRADRVHSGVEAE